MNNNGLMNFDFNNNIVRIINFKKLKETFMNNNTVMNFDFNNNSVRIINFNDEILFVAKDVALLLGYIDTPKAISTHCKKATQVKDIIAEKYSNDIQLDYQTKLIPESDVYRLVSNSRLLSNKEKEEFLCKLFPNNIEKYVLKSYDEIEFVSMLEEVLLPLNLKIVRQYAILKYKIDIYIPEINVCIEYDENNHSGYKNDKQREDEIKTILNCSFIRLNNNKSHLYNIGVVIKQLFQK